MTFVLTGLCHDCPTQAIVAACGIEERTGAAWLTRPGQHVQRVYQHVVKRNAQRPGGACGALRDAGNRAQPSAPCWPPVSCRWRPRDEPLRRCRSACRR